MVKETLDFQDKFLLPYFLTFLNDWEDWVELEFEDVETKEFHFTTIRMLKGAIKPWRSWLKKRRTMDYF